MDNVLNELAKLKSPVSGVDRLLEGKRSFRGGVLNV